MSEMQNKNQSENFDALTTAKNKSGKPKRFICRKEHLVYDCWIIAIRYIFGPKHGRKIHGQGFRDRAESLIETIGMDENHEKKESVVRTSMSLLEAHRTVEDTHARRRLEAWARKVIIWYLATVMALVVANGASRVIWSEIFKSSGFISDSVMYAILTTTTANILGLGFIVLRGHFPSKDANKKSSRKKESETSTKS